MHIDEEVENSREMSECESLVDHQSAADDEVMSERGDYPENLEST